MNPQYLKRTIVKKEIRSRYLDEVKEIQVYLPPQYDETVTYPVLYLQDGDDYFNLGRIATQANQLIYEKHIRPVIMVAVPVDKSKRTAEYSPIGERNRLYLQFFTEELLPEIESEFPVDRTPDGRVVGGSSLGGTVSLHLALEYPEDFRQVLSQSGAFLEATIDRIRQTVSLDDLVVYQSIGKAETAVPTHMGKLDLLARNREVYRHLQDKQAQVHYVEKEGDHTWGLWQKDIPDALKTFFGN
jgi:enterochelin esterase-like enzyme